MLPELVLERVKHDDFAYAGPHDLIMAAGHRLQVKTADRTGKRRS
jgi:hypothetical protein